MFFQAGASGFQDVSQDNRLGKGQAVPRHRRVSLTTGHCGWCQMCIVRHRREFGFKSQATKKVRTTES